MPAAVDLHSLTAWVTAAAIDHPHDLAGRLAERLGVTRPTARRALDRLVAAQWLRRSGSVRRPVHHPGLLRQVVQRYPLAGLAEDGAWRCDFARCFATLPEPLLRLAQHAFCELLNNAIDHSGGSSVTVSLRQTPGHLQLLVSDDGRGLFDQLREAFALPDAAGAMLELSKGRLTSQPERHTGRGLFFTARMADVFELHANGHAFQRRGWESADGHGAGWHAGRPLPRRGTSVYVSIALDTPRTLDTVLRSASLDGRGYALERTQVPLRLITSPLESLDSRAQARHVAARLHGLGRADIDFAGVPHVGPSFADELFRVMPAHRPGLALVPVNMLPAVAAMVGGVGAAG